MLAPEHSAATVRRRVGGPGARGARWSARCPGARPARPGHGRAGLSGRRRPMRSGCHRVLSPSAGQAGRPSGLARTGLEQRHGIRRSALACAPHALGRTCLVARAAWKSPGSPSPSWACCQADPLRAVRRHSVAGRVLQSDRRPAATLRAAWWRHRVEAHPHDHIAQPTVARVTLGAPDPMDRHAERWQAEVGFDHV
jgi:hypothetical protein